LYSKLHNSIFLYLFIFFIFLPAVGILALIVCYSYYRQLLDEPTSASLHGVVHYAYENLNEEETVQNSADSAKFDTNAKNLVQIVVI